MLNIIQNTIGAIRRVGESVVRAGLKMWLPFTKAEPLGGNLVINGDFSDGTNGWTASPSGSTFTVGTHQGRSDVADINITDTSITSRVTQSFDFVEGRAYLFSIDVYLVSGSLRADTIQAVYAPDFVDTTTTGVWQTLTAKFVAGSTQTANIFLRSINQVSEFYVDNVSIEEYAQETPDISGNDNNAILKTGKCLVFDGNDSVETSFPSSKTIKTIAFWIYPTHSANFETLFNLGITNIPVSPLGDRVIQLNHLTISNKSNYPLNFDVYIDGAYRGETNYNGDNPTLLLNQWQRVVLVNSNGTSTVNDTFDVAYTGSGSHGRFKMSDLQIYGAEFTTDDIAYDYANPQKLVTDNASSSVTLNDLHAWWHMSEGDGTIAFDSAPLIGKEEIVNEDFANSGTLTSSSWALGWASSDDDGTNISEGVLNLINDDDSAFDGRAYATNGLNDYLYLGSGKKYVVTYTISENTDNASLNFYFGSFTGAQPNTIGTHTVFHTQSGGALNFIVRNATNNTTIKFSSFSLKEVYNIDGETYDGSSLGATYDDAQERIPQLGMMNWSKGSNLIEYSEDLTQWSELASAVVSFDSSIVNPDNTVGCYKVTYNGTFRGRIEYNVPLDGTVTQSVYLKVDTGTETVKIGGSSGDLGDVTVTDEWQRFSHTATYTGTSTNPRVRCDNSATIYVWGVQYETGTTASAYRRTNGTAVTDATLISSATDSQKDILGNAVRVKGSGFNLDGTGYAEVLDDASINPTTAITIGCWVYFQGNKTDLGIVGKWETNKTDYLIIQVLEGSDRKLRLYLNTTDGNAILSSPAIIGDKWVYVACTYNKDAGSNNTKIYTIIPGNLDGSGNQIIQKVIGTHTGSINDSNNNITIGQYNYTGSTFFDNKIDDVKIYNTDLSEAQIEQNFNATKSGHNN